MDADCILEDGVVAMSTEVTTALIVLTAITLWLAAKHAIAAHDAMKQRDIARHGRACEGRIVAIQRPFLLDSCTRLYVDFLPDGMERAVRACHIDHRPSDEMHASLPAQGALVTIRYLPEKPRQAVIGKLVV
jgi:hypothetical protein